MAEPSKDSDRLELNEGSPPSYEGAAPPSYETANQGAPPSYNEVFGIGTLKKDVMEAKEGSSNKGFFALKFCEIICGSVLCMIGLIILASLPVAMIVIGSIYLDDCEGRDKIPIWLIVFGVFSLAQTAINLLKRCFKLCRPKESDEERSEGERNKANRGGSCLESLISIFLFVWTIVGSVWVFGYYNAYRLCTAENDVPCCHPVPYLFSFITLLVMYVFSILFLCCFCCCFLCIAFIAGLTAE